MHATGLPGEPLERTGDRDRGDDTAISYVSSALETFTPPSGNFELVVSMLALHYIADYRALVRRVAGWLVPGGRFAFSVEHPIYMAPRRPGFVTPRRCSAIRAGILPASCDNVLRWPVSNFFFSERARARAFR